MGSGSGRLFPRFRPATTTHRPTAAAGFHGPVGPSPCRRPCESSFPDSVGIWQELSCVLPIPSWLGRKSSDRGHLLRLCRVTARLFSAPSNVGRVPPRSEEHTSELQSLAYL